jgi:hypothetical protein
LQQLRAGGGGSSKERICGAVVVASSNAPLLGPRVMRIREMFWSVMDREGCDTEFAVQTYPAVMHFVAYRSQQSHGAEPLEAGGSHPVSRRRRSIHQRG